MSCYSNEVDTLSDIIIAIKDGRGENIWVGQAVNSELQYKCSETIHRVLGTRGYFRNDPSMLRLVEETVEEYRMALKWLQAQAVTVKGSVGSGAGTGVATGEGAQ